MSKFIEFIKNIDFDVEKYSSLNGLDDYNLILQLKVRDKMSEWANVIFCDDGMNRIAEDGIKHIADDGSLFSFTDESTTKYINDTLFSYCPDFKKEHRVMLLHVLFYKLIFKKPIDNDLLAIGDAYFTDLEKLNITRNKKSLHEGMIKYMLPYTDNVKALSRFDLEDFTFSKASRGVGIGNVVLHTQDEIEKMEFEDAEKLNSMSYESLNCIIGNNRRWNEFEYEMFLKVELGKTDEEIINDLRMLLPVWRKELDINEPEKKRDWNYIRGKITTYKIIPLIDIMNLAKIYTYITKKRVSKKDIAFLVYPYERDGFGLVQTVMPFLEKIKGKSSQFITEYKITK